MFEMGVGTCDCIQALQEPGPSSSMFRWLPEGEMIKGHADCLSSWLPEPSSTVSLKKAELQLCLQIPGCDQTKVWTLGRVEAALILTKRQAGALS